MMYDSASSITNSEYQDHFIPHNQQAAQNVLPHNNSTRRLQGGLTSLLRQQPKLPPQLPPQLPLQTESQHLQAHCGTHSPPSYVDSQSISPLPDIGGGVYTKGVAIAQGLFLLICPIFTHHQHLHCHRHCHHHRCLFLLV